VNNIIKRSFVALLGTGLALQLAACNNASPKLVGEPPRETRKTEGTELQTFNPSVDILFVIDDSGSMWTHQNNLRVNADLFTAGLLNNKFVDYHIGVISTSVQKQWSGAGGGELYGRVPWIDRSTPNGAQVLKDNIMIGTNGDVTEKVFDPLVKALTDPVLSNQNAGFYRPSAHLAVVVITDAEDQSVLYDPLQTTAFLFGLKGGISQKILTYGVIVPSLDATDCSRDSWDKPLRLEQFFDLTKGSYYGLCDSDYGTKLARIGADLVERVGRRVLLDRRPILDTVRVTYGSQEITPDADFGWSYDAGENSIVLGRRILWSDQPLGTTVQVQFTAL